MVIFVLRPAIFALPRLLTLALKVIGSPNGTGLGEPPRVPVRPLPLAALDSTMKVVELEASVTPPASRTIKLTA
jgi:hypothetical protein